MSVATTELANALGVGEGELLKEAMRALLLDKKREVLQAKLEILSRYGATSLDDLNAKIADGDIVEHPAWEDLIVAENLDHRLGELDEYLRRL
jgi:hypothetical protein